MEKPLARPFALVLSISAGLALAVGAYLESLGAAAQHPPQAPPLERCALPAEPAEPADPWEPRCSRSFEEAEGGTSDPLAPRRRRT